MLFQNRSVFLSYHRATGRDLANRIADALKKKSISVFVDEKDMGAGDFSEQIENKIQKCDFFLVLLQETGFNTEKMAEDWVIKEIAWAVRHKNKNQIIPLFDKEFSIENLEKKCKTPEPFSDLKTIQGVNFNSAYFDACIEKILKLMERSKQNPKSPSAKSKTTITVVITLALLGAFGTYHAISSSLFNSVMNAIAPSAAANSVEHIFKQGEAARYGKGQTQDFNEAAKWFKLAADKGHATAQAELGWLYKRGLGGLPKDIEQATKLIQESAAKGDGTGLAYLGALYQQGVGVNKNEVEAVGKFQQSAKLGNGYGYAYLGFMHEQGKGNLAVNLPEAIINFKKSTELGNHQGQFNLAEMYFGNSENDPNLPRDVKKALQLYQASASQGNARAQNELGKIFERGEHVTKDRKVALEWFKKSEAQGFSKAQLELGLFYKDEKNPEAIKYLKPLAEKGDKDAIEALIKINSDPSHFGPIDPLYIEILRSKLETIEKEKTKKTASETENSISDN